MLFLEMGTSSFCDSQFLHYSSIKVVDFRTAGYYLQGVMQKSAYKNINWWWLRKIGAVAFL